MSQGEGGSQEAAAHDWTRIYAEAAAMEEELDAIETEVDPKASGKAASSSSAGAPGPAPAVPWSRDRSKERRVFDLPTTHKMAGIRRFHARGNLLFDEGQFRRAAIQYKAALLWYEYTFPEHQSGPDGQRALDARRVACLGNLAACHVSMKQWEDAESVATQALREQPDNAKALYRRALARRHRHAFEAAQADIEAAVALHPSELAFRKERALLLLTVREHRRREKGIARRMLMEQESATTPPQGDMPPSGSSARAAPKVEGSSTAADAAGADAETEDAAAPRAEEDQEQQQQPGSPGSEASSTLGSVWTSGGDAVSGLTLLERDDTSSLGGVSQWDGLGAGPDGGGTDANSGYGLATDWATWAAQGGTGGDEDDGRAPVRVSLAGAPKMSFDDLLSAASVPGAAGIPRKGVL